MSRGASTRRRPGCATSAANPARGRPTGANVRLSYPRPLIAATLTVEGIIPRACGCPSLASRRTMATQSVGATAVQVSNSREAYGQRLTRAPVAHALTLLPRAHATDAISR
ncbi:hypothetical protein T492DRAFT_906191, partial [Pavlovales sp. CCMP2436]